MRTYLDYTGGRVTYSDLLYLCALAAVTAGVAILVGVFLGVTAAVGAALIVSAVCLLVSARALANSRDDSS